MRALMIVDVQRGTFMDPAGAPHEGEAVVARIHDLLTRARAAGTPVFFVQHDGGSEDPLLHEGRPGFPFRAELAPNPGEPVTVKSQCSGFIGTDLAAKLRAAGIDHLVICGMQTEYCIDTNVRAAKEHGYAVTLVSDAHTTFDGADLPAAAIIAHHNRVLNGAFATLSPAAEIVFG